MADHPSPRVLVADADSDARDLYRVTFERAGYHVSEAADGREALATALVHVPLLLLTELRLPLIDAFALVSVLRADRQTAQVPVLVVTAEDDANELARAREMADAVLVRPVDAGRILEHARRLLEEPKQMWLRTSDRRSALQSTANSNRVGASTGRRRTDSLVRSYERFATTTPPLPPPFIRCPECDRRLEYERSHVGGVTARHQEQWDYFVCAQCGVFQYRQRTRKLRRLPDDEAQWLKRD